jgi:N-acetylglucosamine-6-phosphate deacetylase
MPAWSINTGSADEQAVRLAASQVQARRSRSRGAAYPLLKTGRDMIKMVAHAPERASALEAIKIAVDHGVVARSATPMPATTRRTLPSRLEPKPRRRPLGSWAWATLSTGDPADLVVLDSTLTPAAVMIGGIWIG